MELLVKRKGLNGSNEDGIYVVEDGVIVAGRFTSRRAAFDWINAYMGANDDQKDAPDDGDPLPAP